MGQSGTLAQAAGALELAALIERRLAAIRSTGTAYHAWRGQQASARELIAELERDHAARYRDGGTISAHRLKLAGISCSCTGGEIGLLVSWAQKARRLSE